MVCVGAESTSRLQPMQHCWVLATKITSPLRFAKIVSSSNDHDFLRLAAGGMQHAGIVYCPPSESRIGEVIRYLALMDECLTPDDVISHVEYL